MNYNKINYTIFVIYLIGIFISIIISGKIIDKKSEKLFNESREIYNNLVDEIFSTKDELIDVAFSNEFIKYQLSNVDSIKPFKDINISINSASEDIKREITEWKNDVKGIQKFYKIDSYYTGWKFYLIKKVGTDIFIETIYPSYVGLMNNSYINLNDFNINNIIYNSYDYFINDRRSYVIDKIEKGSYKTFISKISKINNEYYSLKPLDSEKYNNYKSYGVVYNDFYKVFITNSQAIETYSIYNLERNTAAIEEDKANLTIKIVAIFSIIMLITFLALNYKWITNKFIKPDTIEPPMMKYNILKDYLLNTIHPRNHMIPYNANVVEISTKLYDELIKTDITDIEKILSIKEEALDKLDLNLDVSDYADKLRELCNPQNFMEPFNKLKIDHANKLYNQLLISQSDFNKLIELEGDIHKLNEY